jgi:hypothetical protein
LLTSKASKRGYDFSRVWRDAIPTHDILAGTCGAMKDDRPPGKKVGQIIVASGSPKRYIF